MKLRVLGCSGSFSGPESPASSYLLEMPWSQSADGRTFRMVLDLGSGALGALQRYADLYSIDAVGLSHLHADHCIDLCSYYVARKYHPDGPQPRIPVYGPYATAERMAAAYGLPLEPGMREEFEFLPWAVGHPLRLGPFRITAAVVNHPVAAYALRFEWQEGASRRSLVYSGDTGPSRALEELAKDADLFLCEATFLSARQNPPDVHLTGLQAGGYASRAGVRRLVLTHIPPWTDRQKVLDEAASVYDGPLELAAPGAAYEI